MQLEQLVSVGRSQEFPNLPSLDLVVECNTKFQGQAAAYVQQVFNRSVRVKESSAHICLDLGALETHSLHISNHTCSCGTQGHRAVTSGTTALGSRSRTRGSRDHRSSACSVGGGSGGSRSRGSRTRRSLGGRSGSGGGGCSRLGLCPEILWSAWPTICAPMHLCAQPMTYDFSIPC